MSRYRARFPGTGARETARAFSSDPDCLVFLATDAGSEGLDLSCALCLIQVELPWPPAQMERRMERLRPAGPREGDTDPPTCHIINLMARNSIEERVLAGLKQEANLYFPASLIRTRTAWNPCAGTAGI